MSASPADARVDLLINIDVPDVEAAVRFYTRALGLRLKRRLFEGTVAELDGASAPVFLLEKAAGTPVSRDAVEIRSYRRHWTPMHLDFPVAAIEPAVERAVQAGAKAEGAIQTFRWGRQALMSDPFGNGFCFVQWLGRGYGEEA